MFAICHTRQSRRLTCARSRYHNKNACPPATNIFRASHRTKYGGFLLSGIAPTHSAIAPDLAGFPTNRASGPCTPTFVAPFSSFQLGSAAACSQPNRVEACYG